MNVLLVEDEPRVADFIDRGLRAENHGVTVAGSGTEGVDLAKTGEFDVIVLDLMLPDMHGYDVCQKLRSEGDQTPILMLTAMDTLEDKIKGLKIGADDYLAKPFDFDELLARMEALVRRSRHFAPSSNVLQVADLVLDRDLLEVRRGGETIKLTAKELAILELLMSAPGTGVLPHADPQSGLGLQRRPPDQCGRRLYRPAPPQDRHGGPRAPARDRARAMAIASRPRHEARLGNIFQALPEHWQFGQPNLASPGGIARVCPATLRVTHHTNSGSRLGGSRQHEPLFCGTGAARSDRGKP